MSQTKRDDHKKKLNDIPTITHPDVEFDYIDTSVDSYRTAYKKVNENYNLLKDIINKLEFSPEIKEFLERLNTDVSNLSDDINDVGEQISQIDDNLSELNAKDLNYNKNGQSNVDGALDYLFTKLENDRVTMIKDINSIINEL